VYVIPATPAVAVCVRVMLFVLCSHGDTHGCLLCLFSRSSPPSPSFTLSLSYFMASMDGLTPLPHLLSTPLVLK
jgi:hypothetical protein